MTELVLRPLADAFLMVGVIMAAFAAVAAWLRWRYGASLSSWIAERPGTGVLVGALLGVSPGCAGAILIGAMYGRGVVSFGTLVAALTATMGDASWVVMAADLELAAWLHLMLFVVGLATGFLVDASGVRPRRRADAPPPAGPAFAPTRTPPRPAPAVPVLAGVPAPTRSAAAAVALLSFWLLASAGIVVTTPLTLQLATPADLAAALGGMDVSLVVGVGGTLAAAVLFARARGRMMLADDTVADAVPRSLGAGLAHAAHETAFVTTWVAIAFLAQSLLDGLGLLDVAALPLAGFTGVVIAALIGLVPGCGVQIAFTGIYLAGGMPISTLAANAVAQDGDALLPVLALDRRAAVLTTLITTLPALLVGTIALGVLR